MPEYKKQFVCSEVKVQGKRWYAIASTNTIVVLNKLCFDLAHLVLGTWPTMWPNRSSANLTKDREALHCRFSF